MLTRRYGRVALQTARRIGAEAAVGAAVGAAMLATIGVAPANAQQSCAAQPAKCGALISRKCLTSLGAGSMALGETESCGKQMDSYRSCLSKAAESCPRPTLQQDVNVEADRLEKLARLGGLIDAPKTVVEFYNNALVYARRGDLLNGRVMLEKAIANGAAQIDVYQRYAQLLKAQEGLIGAREIMADIARRKKDVPAAGMAQATLLPGPKREPALRKLAEGGFGPAYYEISQLYSADRLGDQSRSDQRAEKAALEAFQDADQKGKVYRWFLEKDTIEVWRESVRRRLALYRNRNLDSAPVTLSATASNDSWIVTLQIAETVVRKIHYSIDGGPKKATAMSTAINPQTGERAPYPFFNLPLGVETAKIRVWYDNVREEEEGPFDLSFNAKDAFVASSKQILGALLQKWVQANTQDNGRQIVYFSTLLSHRCGLSKVVYGANKPTPDTEFPLTPCDPKRPGAITGDTKIYLTFAKPLKSMSVRLTYGDGEQSETRQFTF